MSAKKKNLDVYLGEVFKQFIALKENDLKRSQEVFKTVFETFKQKMGEQCNYFNKYASQVLYAGSVYDGIKVSKLDEFDMDIVIRLPISYDDGENGIIIENDQPGFVKLKIIKGFDNLDKQKDWEGCHRVTRDWRDSEKYFLQNKFRQWLHGIVQKTINELDGKVTVLGVTYLMKYKASGPAYTLNIRNEEGNEHFLLDVDLVPVIRFMLPRWPEGYKMIENSQIKEWLVVPKPNKSLQDETQRNRLWRLSFQDFERDMIKGCQQLKTTIRLVKKLRDALGMKAIASYYIKTIFLWKVQETNDKKYWQKKISVIFREMVEELYNAIVKRNIPYFWNENNNLIQGVRPTLLDVYEKKLKQVLDSIDANDVEKTIYFLLNTEEIQVFKNSEFYLSQIDNKVATNSNNVGRQMSVSSVNEVDSSRIDKRDEMMVKLMAKVDSLMDKFDRLMVKVEEQEKRIVKLEEEKQISNNVQNVIKQVDELKLDQSTKITGNEKLNVDSEEVDDLLMF